MQSLYLFATFSGLLAAVCWGVSDFVAAHASKKMTSESATLWIAAVSAVAYTIIFAFMPGTPHWDWIGTSFAIAAGCFAGLGLLFFYKGLEVGPVSLVSPVGSAYPLVTTLLFIWLFGGSLSALHLLGIGIIIVGIIIAAGLLDLRNSRQGLKRGLLYGLLTFVLWGLTFALLGQAITYIGWEKATFADIWFELIAVVIALPLLMGRRIFHVQRMKSAFDTAIIAAALLQLGGLMALDVGIAHTHISAIVTAVSASYPALTVFLALKQFKEELSIASLIGAGITILGIVVISIG